MYIRLLESPTPKVYELVWDASSNNHYLTADRRERFGSNRESGVAVVYDKDFLIWMSMKAGTAAWRHIYEYQRDGRTTCVSSFAYRHSVCDWEIALLQ
jgi:hypothetical protein